MEFLTTRPCACGICWRVQRPSTELHLLDSTAHDVFNCKYDVFNLLLTSLARDAYALGSTKVEVEEVEVEASKSQQSDQGLNCPLTKSLYGPLQAQKCLQTFAKMRRLRSSCACAKYHPSLFSLLLHSVVSNDCVSGQWRSWSDCADAQLDLDLRDPHMLEDKFSYGAAQILWTVLMYSK